MRRWAISDIHGCAKTLQALVEDQLQLTTDDELYLLGDFIDRGPSGKAVIDWIESAKSSGYKIYCLKGNHEDMLLKSLSNQEIHDLWAQANGGATTLESFGIAHSSQLPDAYLQFFQNLDHCYPLDHCLVVHAGFNFKSPRPFSDLESMFWIRGYEIDLDQTNGKRIIHGHTPIPYAHIQNSVSNQALKIDIDNGCAYPMPELGGLVALDVDAFTLFRQENIDD